MWRADIEVPNRSVDMSSWERSACYPRRTFYPLSDDPSIQNHRITMSVFRPCSTCPSHSQAFLCHYTLRMITNHTENTFESLRYFLGGDHPSQTTHHTLSFVVDEVRLQLYIEWYFTNDSTMPSGTASKSPTYPTQYITKTNVKL